MREIVNSGKWKQVADNYNGNIDSYGFLEKNIKFLRKDMDFCKKMVYHFHINTLMLKLVWREVEV